MAISETSDHNKDQAFKTRIWSTGYNLSKLSTTFNNMTFN